jgi:hypothetical protein
LRGGRRRKEFSVEFVRRVARLSFLIDPRSLSHEADMRTSILAPLALAALTAIGCRSGGNQELIERELRFQESELYRLHDQLDDAAAKLDALRRENESLKKELDGGDAKPAPSRSSSGDLTEPKVELPPGVGRSSKAPPRSRRPGDKAPPTELISPSVVPGIEMTPDEPALVPNSDAEEVPSSGPPRRGFDAQGASHQQPAVEPRVVDHRIARIVLNRRLTGGPDSDGNSGNGDVRVVFEPRNAAGQFVKATGEVSVVVLDPAVTGPAARVARWDYKPNEVQAHYRSSDGARGYHFDLHWPGRPPAHGSLELFVRLKTFDGRRFIANQSIRVDAAGEIADGKSADAENGEVAAERAAATADETAMQLAARDGQRLRLFSRIRGGSSSDSGKGQSSPAPPEPDGSLNITVPGADGAGAVPPVSSGGGTGSGAPKTARLIDRSKLRGGPGIFDGSRIRSLSGGSRDDKAPPAAGAGSDAPPYRPGSAAGNRGGEAPPFQGSGGGQSTSGEAPRFTPAGGAAQDQGPAMPNVEIPEPIGGPPPGDDGAQSDATAVPPATQAARPIWRPYR